MNLWISLALSSPKGAQLGALMSAPRVPLSSEDSREVRTGTRVMTGGDRGSGKQTSASRAFHETLTESSQCSTASQQRTSCLTEFHRYMRLPWGVAVNRDLVDSVTNRFPTDVVLCFQCQGAMVDERS